jgi:hypothetical protein
LGHHRKFQKDILGLSVEAWNSFLIPLFFKFLKRIKTEVVKRNPRKWQSQSQDKCAFLAEVFACHLLSWALDSLKLQKQRQSEGYV